MKVVTFITDPNNHNYLNLLNSSCHYHNLELSALITNERIKPSRLDRIRNWFFPSERGFQHKDSMLQNFLADVCDTELVLVTDGYDTFFVAGEDEIKEKYESFKAPIVFSAERHCHPDKSMAAKYPNNSSTPCFLNSGGFLGRAKELREAIALVRKIPCPSRFSWSNQYRWSCLFLERPDLIELDYRSSIFFCAASKEEGTTWSPEYWSNNLISQERVLLENDEQPCHIHFNGPISKHLDHLRPALSPLTSWLD